MHLREYLEAAGVVGANSRVLRELGDAVTRINYMVPSHTAPHSTFTVTHHLVGAVTAIFQDYECHGWAGTCSSVSQALCVHHVDITLSTCTCRLAWRRLQLGECGKCQVGLHDWQS